MLMLNQNIECCFGDPYSFIFAYIMHTFNCYPEICLFLLQYCKVTLIEIKHIHLKPPRWRTGRSGFDPRSR